MAITNWDGRLNTNEVYSDLYNTVLKHVIFTDNYTDANRSVFDLSKVDGGLYGDQALYTSYDIGETYDWLGDAEASKLLDVNRNDTEITQSVELDKFRQTFITTDNYLSKRAWTDESAFGQFNSALLQNLKDTKDTFDELYFNTFLGTDETNIGKQKQTITLKKVEASETNAETEARNRIDAQHIAQFTSDLIVDLQDSTRDYNDYGYRRKYKADDLIAVWNSEWVNKIDKMSQPITFNADKALADKFGQYKLPSRYFGTVKTAGGTSTGAERTLVEGDFTGTDTQKVHLLPGDIIPTGATYKANEAYVEDKTIVYKLMHKNSLPYMVGFNASTEFMNPRALNENHYITWGFNTLEHLHNYPFITVRAKAAE